MPAILTLWAALAATAFSTEPYADDLVRLQGAFEIRAPAGMVVPADCFDRTPMADMSAQDLAGLNAVCLESAREDEGRDPAFELQALLSNQGWSVSGGAANAITLERASGAACVQHLTLVTLPRVADASVSDWTYATRLVHVFSLHDERVCEAP